MLEIIGLILLCNVNKKNAVAVGKSGGGAIGLTLGLWIGLEFLGAVIGRLADLGRGAYFIAIVFGVAGGVASYFISKKPAAGQGAANTVQQPANQQPQYNPSNLSGQPQYPQGGFCIKCGHRLEQGMTFCPICGTAAMNQQASPVPQPVQSAVIPQPVYAATMPNPQATPISASPVNPPKTVLKKSVFYVFAVLGPAFGAAATNEVIIEKAKILKDDYGEPAKDMELKIIYPNMWKASLHNSSTDGIISISYTFNDFKAEIRKYLTGEGITRENIENGISLGDTHSLQLTNPMSGIFVMGVPIALGTEAAAQQLSPAPPVPTPVPVPAPCLHEYNHFVCLKCSAKAPKPQLEFGGIRKRDKYTYEDYFANTVEEARYFLEQMPVSAPFYYIMVQTPEGEWGKDKDSIFLSQLCDFQQDLSLRQCDAKSALIPERMQDLEMAANKVADNYLLSLACGRCNYSWIDGVGYRTKTIVKCPDCTAYNLVDTQHIRVNNL